METLIRKLFLFFYCVFAHPYKVRIEPGLYTVLSLKSGSIQYNGWIISVYVAWFYVVSTGLSFIYLIPSYLKYKQFEKLAFHGFWLGMTINFMIQHYPTFTRRHRIVQLSNGLFSLMQNLEKGNVFSRFFCKLFVKFQNLC